METDNYQSQLVSKDVESSIDDVSVLFDKSTDYELKVVLVLYIECYSAMPEKIGRIANVFVKVSLGKRRCNKNAKGGSATSIKS